MSKIYYVASRASNPERPKMWRDLRDSGVNIISSWIDDNDVEVIDFSELWDRIEGEIFKCDILIFYAEEEDFPLKGAYVEAGMAIAFHKKVFVVTKNFTPESFTCKPIGSWINHPSVTIVKTLEECFA